jgi:hypothetical protein
VCGEAKVGEDSLDGVRCRDGGDHHAPPTTIGAAQNINGEDALHQLCPGVTAVGGSVAFVSRTAKGSWTGYDAVSPSRGGREHAVIRDEVRSRPWNEGGQTLEEDERFEYHVRSAIPPRPSETIEDVALPRDREPLDGDGGPGDIAAKTLEPIAIAGRHAHARVEREAVDLGTELAWDVGDLATGPRAYPRESSARALTQSYAAGDGGRVDRLE